MCCFEDWKSPVKCTVVEILRFTLDTTVRNERTNEHTNSNNSGDYYGRDYEQGGAIVALVLFRDDLKSLSSEITFQFMSLEDKMNTLQLVFIFTSAPRQLVTK
jgi:hypothetical protein